MNLNSGTNLDRLKLKRTDAGLGKTLKSISNFGQVYNKEAIKQKVGESDDPRLESNEYQLLNGYVNSIDVRYSKFNRLAYNQFDEIRKRNFLIELSLQPEIEDILDTLSQECIVKTANSKYVFSPIFKSMDIADLKDSVDDAITEHINTYFPVLYKMLDFHNGGAKKLFRNWLIWGKISFEIVYDSLEKPTKIIGIIPIDAITLEEKFSDGHVWWIQQPKFGINVRERILHDSQIIMINWDEDYGRISYVERLLRYFNIYRIMERSKILWFITHSQSKTLFTIPTAGRSRAKAAQTLASAMHRYSDNIEFNDSTGQLFVNGEPQWQSSKEYWLADGDAGKPNIEAIDDTGHNLSETQSVSYWKQRLYEISKIPINRFDPSQSDSWTADPTSQKREEIKFSTFVNDNRDKFSEVVLKPLKISLCLDFPDLLNDNEILDSVILEYQHNNVFNELAEMEILEKKVDFIDKLQNALTVQGPAGREHNFFPQEYLVTKYLGLTEEEIKEIKKIKKKEDMEIEAMEKHNVEEFGEDIEFKDVNY